MRGLMRMGGGNHYRAHPGNRNIPKPTPPYADIILSSVIGNSRTRFPVA